MREQSVRPFCEGSVFSVCLFSFFLICFNWKRWGTLGKKNNCLPRLVKPLAPFRNFFFFFFLRISVLTCYKKLKRMLQDHFLQQRNAKGCLRDEKIFQAVSQALWSFVRVVVSVIIVRNPPPPSRPTGPPPPKTGPVDHVTYLNVDKGIRLVAATLAREWVLSITQPYLVVVLVALLHRWTIGAIVFLCKTSNQKRFWLCNGISAVASWSCSCGHLALTQFF